MNERISEHQTLLSPGDEQENLAHVDERAPLPHNNAARHGALSGYFDAVWRWPRHQGGASGGKSPISLLSRSQSPEEAPLLYSSSEDLTSTPRQSAQGKGKGKGRQRRESSRFSENQQLIPDWNSRSNPGKPITYLWMAVLSSLLVAVAPLLAKILYEGISHDQYCVYSIYYSYNYLSFAGSHETFWESTCRNPVKVASMFASAKTYCNPAEIAPGFRLIDEYCHKDGLELLDLGPIAANMTEEYISSLRVVDFEEISRTTELTEPVLLSLSYFEKAFRTVSTWYWEKWTHHAYGLAFYGFWAGILLCGIASNAWYSLSGHRAVRRSSDIEGRGIQPKRNPNRFLAPVYHFSHYFRTYISVPAAFGQYHQRLLWWCTIPTRWETIVVFSFWTLAVVLSCISYEPFTGNMFWPDVKHQLWRYISDRTGILSYATLPLIWVFATRNNGFLWATGWSYRTFNIYHRHVARIGTLLAIVHSIGYTYLYISYQGYASYREAITSAWLALGIVATVTMSCLWIFSHAWVRVKFYESFLLIHIALSLVTLIALFFHTSVFGHEYDAYLWPVVAVWSTDRLLRIVRIIYCNFQATFSKHVIRTTNTVATYNKESDVIRLEVEPAHSLIEPSPGQFFYLYQPLSWTGYENHPFTLGAYNLPIGGFGGATSSSADDNDMKQVESAGSSFDSDDCSRPYSGSSNGFVQPARNRDKKRTLVFWVRPYDGWTKRLRDSCLRSASGICHPKLLLEGPYGHTELLHTYDNVLLIAGGTGIASAVPYILDHMARSKTSNTHTTDIQLVWTARQKAFIDDLCQRELAPALLRPDVQASFFSTRLDTNKETDVLCDDMGDCKSDRPVMPHIKVQDERPDIRNIILGAARKAHADSASLAVLVCGPAGMADASRAAVQEALKAGCHSVEYVEEAFGW